MTNLYWKRVRPGLYMSTGAGAPRYMVGRTESGEWYAEGPNVDAVYRSKGDAQQACQWAVSQ